MPRKNERNTYTDARGKFSKGNPGRPKGSRNKTTQVVEALLDGEAEALTRCAVEKALEGDTTALRLCLARIAPPTKDAPVQFSLPKMETARDAATAASAVLRAVSEGDLTPTEGAHVMQLVETYRRTLELSDVEARIVALEEAS